MVKALEAPRHRFEMNPACNGLVWAQGTFWRRRLTIRRVLRLVHRPKGNPNQGCGDVFSAEKGAWIGRNHEENAPN